MATTVDCPTCGSKVAWITENQYRPFCSDRCKQIDLGAWATEQYAIPVAPNPQEAPGDSDDSNFAS